MLLGLWIAYEWDTPPGDGVVLLGGGGNVYYHHEVLHEKNKKLQEAKRLEAKLEEAAQAIEEPPAFTETQRQEIELLTGQDVVLYYHKPELLTALAEEVRLIIEGYRMEIREIERQRLLRESFMRDEDDALALLMTIH
jgi:hypothetical protein